MKGLHRSDESHHRRAATGWREPAKQSHDYRRGRDRTDRRNSAGLWRQRSGRPSRETFGPPGGLDRGTWAHRTRPTGCPWSRRRPGRGSDGGRHGPSGPAAPIRFRPFPRCGHHLDDPGPEAGRALRPAKSGPSGLERPKDARFIRATRQSPGGPGAGTRRHPRVSASWISDSSRRTLNVLARRIVRGVGERGRWGALNHARRHRRTDAHRAEDRPAG